MRFERVVAELKAGAVQAAASVPVDEDVAANDLGISVDLFLKSFAAWLSTRPPRERILQQAAGLCAAVWRLVREHGEDRNAREGRADG